MGGQRTTETSVVIIDHPIGTWRAASVYRAPDDWVLEVRATTAAEGEPLKMFWSGTVECFIEVSDLEIMVLVRIVAILGESSYITRDKLLRELTQHLHQELLRCHSERRLRYSCDLAMTHWSPTHTSTHPLIQ